MTRLLLLLLFILPISSEGQQFLDKPGKEMKLFFKQKKDSLAGKNIRYSEKGKELILTEKKAGKDFIRHEFSFDSLGNCSKEKVIASSEALMQEKLSPLLAQSEFAWKKINENQYISKFEDRLMIELSPEKGDYSFSILRMGWTKVLYDILIAN
ncbi:MAG TPA: hypothetical protein VFV31_10835 [Chitinophagaceae bacterium]|nr:hypothetical protein [Chitinophagaceae bacterium]